MKVVVEEEGLLEVVEDAVVPVVERVEVLVVELVEVLAEALQAAAEAAEVPVEDVELLSAHPR